MRYARVATLFILLFVLVGVNMLAVVAQDTHPLRDTQSYFVVKDTYIAVEGTEPSPNGTREELRAGFFPHLTRTEGILRAYIDFGQLPNLPPGATLNSATLELHYFHTEPGAGGSFICLVTEAWDEDIIGRRAPPCDEQHYVEFAWESGYDGAPKLLSISLPSNLIEALQVPQRSLMIRHLDETQPGVEFCSRNWQGHPTDPVDNCQENHVPRLVIDYDLEPTPTDTSTDTPVSTATTEPSNTPVDTPVSPPTTAPTITVTPPAPRPPELRKPKKGTSITALFPTFKWRTSTYATSYQLVVKNTTTKQIIFAPWINYQSCNLIKGKCKFKTFEQIELVDGTKYKWYVIAANAAGQTVKSKKSKFTADLLPDQPLLRGPMNTARNVNNPRPPFRWKQSLADLKKIDTYELIVTHIEKDTKSFTTLKREDFISPCTKPDHPGICKAKWQRQSPNCLDNGKYGIGDYKWRVIAKRDLFKEGKYETHSVKSDVFTFHVPEFKSHCTAR